MRGGRREGQVRGALTRSKTKWARRSHQVQHSVDEHNGHKKVFVAPKDGFATMAGNGRQ